MGWEGSVVVIGCGIEPISCDTVPVASALLLSPAAREFEDVVIAVVSMLLSKVRSTEEAVVMSLASDAALDVSGPGPVDWMPVMVEEMTS